MAGNLVSSSFSSVAPLCLSTSRPKISVQCGLLRQPIRLQYYHLLHLKNDKVKHQRFSFGAQKTREECPKKPYLPLATSEEKFQYIEYIPNDPQKVSSEISYEATSRDGSPSIHFGGNDGKPGFVSFYNRLYKTEETVVTSEVQSKQGSLLWFSGPAVLVASFIFPPLYLRRIISAMFEDSLLTDFLILFFTEALFYCGVAAFLLLIDHLRSARQNSAASDNTIGSSLLGQRISSVATLVLSLVIPMVTMGFVWPWTGPAASATLAPYLVGVVVQFAFEQYARYRNSPSRPVIPIIFQIYRLHQLNRATQLVTALSFTVKGAEATAHNLAINKSLGTLVSVLQVLGVICIWSISSFLMRVSPSTLQD